MKILYAEDEKQLSMAVAEILKIEGFEVDAVYDGETAVEKLSNGHYDIAILDIMMPKKDGIEVLTYARENGNFIPVLLLTAKAEADDRILGLSKGADDYLAKPFVMGELVARIKAMARRTTEYHVKDVQIGNLVLDMESNEIKTDVGSLRISNRESVLLKCFMESDGKSFSATELFDVLRSEVEDEMAVDLYVSYLRNKLRQIQADYYISESEGMFTFVSDD